MPVQARILVVEDEVPVRLSAADVLEGAGFEVLEAGSGEEALAMIEAEPGAITHLFTDVRMPGPVNGMALARLVAALYPTIHVLVTSADVTLEEDADVHSVHFLPKPWTEADMLAAVRQ